MTDLIQQAWAELVQTTKSGSQMVKSYGSDVSKWPAGHWVNAKKLLDQAEAPAPSPVPAPTPAPPPAPSGDPTLYGVWLSTKSPWRTPIPADWQNYVHPDTPQMVQGKTITGTLGTQSGNIHAHAYDAPDMQTKWGSAGLTFMKWLGPGPKENVVYAKAGDPLTRIYKDHPSYKASYVECPLPFNWTGYDMKTGFSYFERRTILVCDDGRAWAIYAPTPPGAAPAAGNGPADSFWHASDVAQIPNWTSDRMIWPSGGSGQAFGNGLIRPCDFANLSVGGWINHALALNTPAAADGSAHPKIVWPGYAPGYNGDGLTAGAVGIPHGARVFLDPSLTDSDLDALGCTKEWMKVLARTMQRYGAISKESTMGQGEAGGIMCETNTSIAWNASQGIPGYGTASNPYKFPWVADGTCSNADHVDSSYYAAAFPAALMPMSGSHWKVFDWTKSYPGITVAA